MNRFRVSRVAAPALLGAAVVLLFFGDLVPPSRVLAVRDLPSFHLPLRLVGSSLARAGEPWWNPMIHGGQPILSNPNYAAFYPPTWLALVVPVPYALSVIAILHAAWAFAGAWLLARRLGCRPAARALAAVAFVASGAFVAVINSFNLYCGLAWLPWVLNWGELGLRGDSRRARTRGTVLAGAAVAAQLLSGEPYSPTIGALALLGLALGGGAPWFRLAGRIAAMLALSGLLGAAQLLPTLLHLADSPRLESLAEAQRTTWSTRPDRFVEWVFPNLHGDPTQPERGLFFGQGQHDRGVGYLPSIYVGQLVLVLAVAALLRRGTPHRAVWAALIVGGIVLALGRHSPLDVLLARVPPFSILRYPEKFLLLSTSGLAFAAALGWERLLAGREARDSRAMTLPSTVALVMLAVAGAFFVLPFVRPDLVEALVTGGDTVADSAAMRTNRLAYLGLEAAVTFALALASVIVLALHRARRVHERVLMAVVLALVLADLYRTGRSWVVTARTAELFEPPAVMATLPQPSARLWTDWGLFAESTPRGYELDPASSIPPSFTTSRAELFPYWANLWGRPYALNEDYDLTLTAPARHALGLFRDRTGLAARGWTDLPMVYLGAWNVCNVARRRSPDALDEEFRRTGQRPHRVRILDNPFCLDRYRFVERAEIHGTLEDATESAERHRFEVAGAEFLVAPQESSGEPVQRSYADDARVSSVEEKGGTVALTYTASRPALLVAAITFDRGWRAEVEGDGVALLPTAIGQMAAEVPPGTHRVTLRYRDRSVWIGVAISLATTVVALGGSRLAGR